jgi:hypothetical protein
MKSGNLNFLETSGPLQACNGTALPLPLLSGFGTINGVFQNTAFYYGMKSISPETQSVCYCVNPLKLFVCLFSCRYNPLWLYFHSPVAGFSLLVFEVS